jgi:hypothetical protein
MFQLMRLQLILGRISIYVFSRRRRECSILMIGVSRRRRRRQDGTDHIMVEVIDRLRRVVGLLMPMHRTPEPRVSIDIWKLDPNGLQRTISKRNFAVFV